MREIRLIIAATKNSQIPQINMTQCDFLMCGDVLTDTVHLSVIWGNASCPRGICKIQSVESASFKIALIIWLMCQTYFAVMLSYHSFQSWPTVAGLTLKISSQS